MSKTKKITLRKYIKTLGSMEKAAVSLSLCSRTLARWLAGEDQPHEASINYLELRGIDMSEFKKVDTSA